MDDFVLSNLQESRNEWCSRLISIFSPLLIEGVRSIFNEAWSLCVTNSEPEKYLMTFQNLLSRVPKWNSVIVFDERDRIVQRSGCNYLEDLITCVHIIQLKVLTCIRVGNKQKKIDISIPKLDHFIHKVYINVARKVYTNTYLFEKNITPLQMQKNNRELELIVQDCILVTIRESIPTEDIIRAYMDESVEHEETVTIENLNDTELAKITEDKKESESKDEEKKDDTEIVPSIRNINEEEVVTRLTFNDVDTMIDTNNEKTDVLVSKDLDNLERIATSNAIQRKLEEEDDDMEDRLKIHTDDFIELDGFESLDEKKESFNDAVVLDDVVELM